MPGQLFLPLFDSCSLAALSMTAGSWHDGWSAVDATAATELEENSLAGYMTISLEHKQPVIKVPGVETLIDFVYALIRGRPGGLDGF